MKILVSNYFKVRVLLFQLSLTILVQWDGLITPAVKVKLLKLAQNSVIFFFQFDQLQNFDTTRHMTNCSGVKWDLPHFLKFNDKATHKSLVAAETEHNERTRGLKCCKRFWKSIFHSRTLKGEGYSGLTFLILAACVCVCELCIQQVRCYLFHPVHRGWRLDGVSNVQLHCNMTDALSLSPCSLLSIPSVVVTINILVNPQLSGGTHPLVARSVSSLPVVQADCAEQRPSRRRRTKSEFLIKRVPKEPVSLDSFRGRTLKRRMCLICLF